MQIAVFYSVCRLQSFTWYADYFYFKKLLHQNNQFKKTRSHLMDCDTIDVCVVNKPNNLVAEKFPVVLRRQVRFSGLATVQLQTFPDSLSQDVQGGIGLHYLSHCLLDERLATYRHLIIAKYLFLCQIS